ncbi:hypothetical protein L208DRAFT_1496338 [Tricholoma matsutake]|nr:hypothetical protein L208DRAFT_1496338 [Tricholoma matsutake 945]
MIALCHAKCWIVQLSEQGSDLTFPQNQWGFHGNIIIYSQQSQKITTMLPPSIEEVVSPIFVGFSPPSAEWLCDKAKPSAVHADKVRRALLWLKGHNPLYSDIKIDHDMLNSLPENGILPFHVEHVLPNVNEDVLTSHYDATQLSSKNQSSIPHDAEITFHKLVISDAAIRHVQKKKGGYLKLPHDPTSENEFVNPNLFPRIYPTLFPFGLWGFEDQT